MSSLVYSHVNLHSLVKMANGDCSVFVCATLRRGPYFLWAEGNTVNIRSTN